MSSDPNGWVASQTFVKIVGTSRDALNGKVGLVLSYASDRSRYVVHLGADQVALKSENLQKASYFEQIQAQFRILRDDPNVQRQIQAVYDKIAAVSPVKPEYLAGGLLVSIVASGYFLGVSKTLMIISFLMMVLMIVAPDLTTDPSRIVANFPFRLKQTIRESIPYVGPKIAASDTLTAGMVGLMLYFLARTVMAPSSTVKKAAAPASPFNPEHYYKLGFEDSTEDRAYGFSMPTADEPRVVMDDSSWPMDPLPAPKKSPWNFSTAMSIMYLGRTVWSLGQDGTGRWSPSAVIHNVRQMDAMRLAFLGLAVYRVVNAFL